MNPLELPNVGPSADWLIFLVMLGAIGLAVSIVMVWMVVFRPKSKKRRKRHHRHRRNQNPTLAKTGGLPPVRDPDQSPPGL